MLVHVVMPKAEEAAATAAAEARRRRRLRGGPAEPEVIKKGKTDEKEGEKKATKK